MTSPPPQPGPPTRAAVVARDAACVGCEYNLRTLSLDGRCPECGMLVAHSLKRAPLAQADPQWRRTVAHGLRLYGWIVAVGLVLSTFYAVWAAYISVVPGQTPTMGFELSTTLNVAIAAATLIAFWLITRPEPGRQRVLQRLRLFTLLAAVAHFLCQMTDHAAMMLVIHWDRSFGGSPHTLTALYSGAIARNVDGFFGWAARLLLVAMLCVWFDRADRLRYRRWAWTLWRVLLAYGVAISLLYALAVALEPGWDLVMQHPWIRLRDMIGEGLHGLLGGVLRVLTFAVAMACLVLVRLAAAVMTKAEQQSRVTSYE